MTASKLRRAAIRHRLRLAAKLRKEEGFSSPCGLCQPEVVEFTEFAISSQAELCAVLSVIMSFCFNFDVTAQTANPDDGDGKEFKKGNNDNVAKSMEDVTKPAEPVKEAKKHLLPSDLQFLPMDTVFETVTIGSLPPLHFLNETVFENTASEREDGEKILSRTAEQKSDLISGVYEGGLKVWECTYDLLELVEKHGETFGGKAVLDLGCGAGLLGILALKRGASQVHFQDYNSTVIEQLTVPNVILNCQENDELDSEDDGEGRGKGKKHEDVDCDKKVKEKKEVKDSNPPPKKRAVDLAQHPSVAKCFFFSGDWSTFLALVLKTDPPPKYDIIFTSETIYNTTYYPALHEALHKLLAAEGVVYLATKSHYFGVGGGLHLFKVFVEQRGIFSVDHLWDGEEGLQRHVIALRFKTAKAS